MNVTYDDAKAYVIDIFDFYTDPYCPIKDSRSNICRYEYFPSELVAL